jgi:DNA repair protein RadC
MAALKIRELPASERPRERLSRLGAGALSNAELIAILLRTGVRGANAVDLAHQLLDRFKSLNGLSRCNVAELAVIKGIGPAKAVQLAAAFGLAARTAQENIAHQRVDTPQIVCDLLGPDLRLLRKESLRILLLDTRYQLIRQEEISLGTMNESLAHPREIFRPALVHSAYAVIVAHNHPSGDPTPSEADHRLTRRLAEAASLLQITLLDHIIIGSPQPGRAAYFSFKEAGVL